MQWPAPQADKLELLEQFDNYAKFRNGIRSLAGVMEEWAGIPMPLDDDQLVIEPKYRQAAKLMEIGAEPVEPTPENCKTRNVFWSHRWRTNIVIYEENGKVKWGAAPSDTNLERDISTLGASSAWGIEQESRAVQTLAKLVRHHQMKTYLLTGMFLERSTRSGLTYLFRKLKPTVVLDARHQEAKTTPVLCALCLHPIAYYRKAGVGAMTPTDDVIAHLVLMRGDEKLFWRRSNQHPPDRPEARII